MKKAIIFLTALGLGFAVGTYRERSILKPEIEDSYHDGESDGYATGIAESRKPRIMEDDPRWDCKTMGNKICGPKVANKK